MKIRKRMLKSGGCSWQLDCGLVNGKRLQVAFRTREDAENELRIRREQMLTQGTSSMMLSPYERMEMMAQHDRVIKAGGTLREAVDFYLKHVRPSGTVVTVGELIELCLEAKREERLSDRYLTQLKSSANSFARAGYELRKAHEITVLEVTEFLKSNQWEPKTWNNYRTDLRTIFQWGIENGALTINPCDEVPRKKIADGEIAFMAVDDVERFLNRAAVVKPGALRRDERGVWIEQDLTQVDFRDCLAAAVLGMFCGLRPERELGEMTWDAVREDVVWVRGHTAKSRSRRVVDLPENARAWLALCPSRDGKILPANFTRKWKALRQAVKLFDAWPHDSMRHTFATMWLAEHGDEKRLQLLMGHVSAELIYKHYRGQTTPAEARRFWGLRPTESEQVQMQV